MRRSDFSVALSLTLVIGFASTEVDGQEKNQASEERAVLLAERDVLGQQGIASANRGDFDEAIELFDRVLEIERSVFGDAHEELLGTLDYQSQIAHGAQDWQREIELRRRAHEMGKAIYGEGNYQLRDLELALKEARDNATRTDQQRQQLRRATALNSQITALNEQGRLAPAVALAEYEKVKTIREKVLGKEHPDYAQSVFNLSFQYQAMGDYARAEPLLVQAKTIWAKVLGKEHPDYAFCLHKLGELYQAMGDYAQAEPLHFEAKAIYERVLGKQHPSYAHNLNALAMLYYRAAGDHARAEPLYLEASAIYEKVFGREHRDYAASVNNLGVLYERMGDYARAEPLLVEAKTIWAKLLGKEHPNYAASLNSLAVLYGEMGDYARAEPLSVESTAICEKVLGKEHPLYAESLKNLAELYHELGDYARAEPLLVEAITIQEKVLGKEHPDYAGSLNNLARMYTSMGDYARAEELVVEAKTIREKVLGKEHPDYAVSLSVLAGLYFAMGDYARAEPLDVEAKTIVEKVFGKEHPRYATSLNNLAAVYRSMGAYARAEPLMVEAKTIREEFLGREHPDYATSLNSLAVLYKAMGDYGRAEPLYLEARAIQEKVLGREHPDYTTSLSNLAGLYKSMGDYTRAEPLYQEATNVTLGLLERTAFVQSEQQQLAMNQKVRYRLDNYLGCCIEGGLSPEAAVERLVQWKGAILRRGRGIRLAAADPSIAEQLRQLQSVASQISAATRSVPEAKQIEVWRKRLDSLAERQRRLEAELMARSAAFREASKEVSFDQIRQSIPTHAVLVDYLEYKGKRGRSLAASVIRRTGQVVLLDLGNAADVAQAIDQWRASYGRSGQAQLAGARLRQQLWEPLLAHLQDAELILVSTDGVLGRLPIAALPGAKPGSYLIEDHRIASIPVPQLLPDLVTEASLEDVDNERLLLVGDVDYGARKPTEKRSPQPATETLAATRAAYGLEWQPLEETGREVEFIKELFQQTRQANHDAIIDFRETAATESAFRDQAPRCQLMHLATHGFFAPADKKNALAPDVIAESQDATQFLGGQQRQQFVGFSPGQLSGLVFAGANRPLESLGPLSEEAEEDDGIMTADEIAYLPLDEVELAVLSACETGLGQVAGGEGLIGIQRAFQVSGVDSVVATMWKVDDTMTRVLMERFYRNLFEQSMSKLDALREAQLWVLKHPSMVEKSIEDRGSVRKKKVLVDAADPSGQRTNPYYWAPFVLSGDWR